MQSLLHQSAPLLSQKQPLSPFVGVILFTCVSLSGLLVCDSILDFTPGFSQWQVRSRLSFCPHLCLPFPATPSPQVCCNFCGSSTPCSCYPKGGVSCQRCRRRPLRSLPLLQRLSLSLKLVTVLFSPWLCYPCTLY